MDKSRAKVGHGASALGPEGTGSNDLWLPGEYCNDISPVRESFTGEFSSKTALLKQGWLCGPSEGDH